MSAPPLLQLDYQRPPPGTQRPGIALLVLSLLVAGGMIFEAVQLSSQLDAAGIQLQKARQSAERRRVFATTESATPVAVAPIPSSGRWENLLAALEAAGNDHVTLLSLAPGQRQILITGEAEALPAVLDYAQRLQSAPALRNAHLAKYEIVREHPRQPVRFTVMAEWREG